MPAVRRAVRPVGLFRAGLLILPASLAAAPAPAVDPGVTVRFVEPAPPGLIQGETRITVEAKPGPGARIVGIAIFADGALLTILETPPFTLTWDAGTKFTRRVLKAVATDSSGSRGEAVLVARPLRIGQYEEVRLVNVYATVRDRHGRPVLDLRQGDFVLLEDGVPQTVTHFSSARIPLTAALLIDASNSMNLGGKLELARRAAEDFVRTAAPEDDLLVLHFNDRLHGPTEPTRDRKVLLETIAAIRAEGGTGLYDAVFRTAGLLAGRDGRRAIVLLSDGRDQALSDNEPGSLHLFEEALREAHRSDVSIYTIGVGRHLEGELDLRRARSLKEILETLARQTGGRAYLPERASALSGIYREIASDLQRQYGLGYTSTNPSRDGRWRSISLRAADPGLEVQARTGYYAPGPGAP